MTGQNLNKAIQLLKQGQIVALPTETVYGLAANALDPEAVASIFEAKRRPFFDPLIVHIKDLHQLNQIAFVRDQLEEKLLSIFWPGPMTILLPKKSIVPEIVTSGLQKVAVRMPSNPLFKEILLGLDFPLAAPSANPFGFISPTTAAHVEQQLGQTIPYIVDGGAALHGLESTIVEVLEGKVIIRRLGAIAIEEFEAAGFSIDIKISSNSKPNSPGNLDSHYAPRTPLQVLSRSQIDDGTFPSDAAFLLFKQLQLTPIGIATEILSPEGDLVKAAANLFKAMHSLDKSGASKIIAEEFPEIGLGRAINDRLRRAAFKS